MIFKCDPGIDRYWKAQRLRAKFAQDHEVLTRLLSQQSYDIAAFKAQHAPIAGAGKIASLFNKHVRQPMNQDDLPDAYVDSHLTFFENLLGILDASMCPD